MPDNPKDKIHDKSTDYKKYKPEIEASLFISGRIMSIEELARVCKTGNLSKIRSAVEELQREYRERNSGIEIYVIKNSGGMRPKQEIEDRIMHLAPEGDMPHSMIKTLALIAYKQPVNQSEVARIRGGGVYDHIHKLTEMDLITAKKQGRTKILSTTPNFNKYFQVEDLSEMVKGEMVKPAGTKKGKAKGKPVKNEPLQTGLMDNGTLAGEKVETEAVKTETAVSEPVKIESAPVEPKTSEPKTIEPAKTNTE